MSETAAAEGSGHERSITWISMLRTIRAPFAILLLAGLALLLPPQTADMLAALGDGRGSISSTIRFHLALALLALSAWYWSRALVAARFDVPDSAEARRDRLGASRRAYDMIPRLMYVLALLIGFGMILRSGAWSSLLWLSIWGALLGLAVYWRTRLESRLITCLGLPPLSERPRAQGQWIGKTSNPCEWVRSLPSRFRLLIERAPWPNSVSIVFFALAILIFVWGTLDAFVPWPMGWRFHLPGLAAWFFPGPAVALAALALIIAPLSVLTFLLDGLDISILLLGLRLLHRPPVVTVLVTWVLIAPTLFSLHTVRIVAPADRGMRPQARQDLGALFGAWASTCQPGPGPVRPIVVAISGGASRAAIWGERVLHEVEQDAGAKGPRVFAVSSVSGGSLGVAAYMAALAGMEDSKRCGDDAARQTQMHLLQNHELSEDALGPLLGGALLVDIPRALFTPLSQIIRGFSGRDPRGGDRAEALERSFEGLWRGVALTNDQTKPFGFDRPYLSLFYDGGSIRPGMPLWIANGTDLATGSRLVTVPFDPHQAWPLAAAEDALAALGADVPISTAINNTARFPFLEPAGELLEYASPGETALPPLSRRRQPDGTAREVIDGGYFDNEGLQTALDLADWLHRNGPSFVNERAVDPIIVQATGDGDVLPSENVVRCGSRKDEPTEIAATRRPLQLLAPVLGLNSTRGGHAAVLLRLARAAYCPDDSRQAGQRFFHFYLPADGVGPVPWNWILSDSTARFIWDGAMRQGGNPREAERMRQAFQAP
jgi:hypothetical protein